MVFNLCLPPFQTAIHSNKLCADGYDVTNLVSADPVVRRRGFKLEYFVRPPLQVTLTFDLKVELCRVDVELWPSGMDRGQACKKLEISTCSDSLASVRSDHLQQKTSCDKTQTKDSPLPQSNGLLWSIQARDGGEGAAAETQSSTDQSNRESAVPHFKLVGRCELQEETKVCFSPSHFGPRPPFQRPPPPPPTNCRHEALWSRGAQSLSAVTQLRVALPFGGAASALGLKALSVWGQPAKCCPAEQVEKIQKALEATERRTPRPVSVSSVCLPKHPQKPPTSQSFLVPEEFLDPITQEVMVLPMMLPSGVSVDHSTLDEYQKREATWGRAPNDPFTSVPFTASSQPLPNPQLKSRIDHFLLQSGQLGQDGRLGRQTEGKHPQASRLVASQMDTGPAHTPQKSALKCEQVRNRDTSEDSPESQEPQPKRSRNDEIFEATCSSHEQRLSASLDEALCSALQGRPSFTSNLSLNSASRHLDQLRPTAETSSSVKKSCSGCSCVISIYTSPSSPIYRLPCGHFLCRSCLQKPSKTLNPNLSLACSHVSCPSCQSTSLRSHITRVHH